MYAIRSYYANMHIRNSRAGFFIILDRAFFLVYLGRGKNALHAETVKIPNPWQSRHQRESTYPGHDEGSLMRRREKPRGYNDLNSLKGICSTDETLISMPVMGKFRSGFRYCKHKAANLKAQEHRFRQRPIDRCLRTRIGRYSADEGLVRG